MLSQSVLNCREMLIAGAESSRGRSEPSNTQPAGARAVITPARTGAAHERIRAGRTRDSGAHVAAGDALQTSDTQTYRTSPS